MRMRLEEIFTDNGDGTHSPKGRIRIGGITVGPGLSLRPGKRVLGIDIAEYLDCDLEVEKLPGGDIAIRATIQLNKETRDET